MIKFIELRRCENVKSVVASDLFPDIENIIAMERKYGDALTDEDVNGKECPPQKAVTRTVNFGNDFINLIHKIGSKIE